MEFYLVGGAVRDCLLGLPVKDRDFVVVSGNPETMLGLGFTQVGKDFPVFLHPYTRDEYALARQERSVGVGYRDFEFETRGVTLQEDLSRRDLTVNAMAMPLGGNFEDSLIDPFGGFPDLKNKVLRHVSDAFKEDPVRVLRVARFMARYGDFQVASETMQLMRDMVESGALNALNRERVWKELSGGLMEKYPSKMILTLKECGALKVLMPELDALAGVPQAKEHHPEVDTLVHICMTLDYAAKMGYGLEVRFACLVHDFGKGLTLPDMLPKHHGHEKGGLPLVQGFCERLGLSKGLTETALLVTQEHGNVHRSGDGSGAKALFHLLERCGAIRNPNRFHSILKACECDARGREGLEGREYPQVAFWQEVLGVALIDTKKAAQEAIAKGLTGVKVGEWVRSARIAALREYFKDRK